MRCRALGYWSIWMLTAAVAVSASSAFAQVQQGVVVDANGVLHMKSVSDPDGMLMKERIASAKATLGPRGIAYSKLRKVSLTRLEQALTAQNGVLNDEMRYLAGLLRVRYVFCYPESKDVVLAGPAEGWTPDAVGRVVGITTHRPVVQLQDLVVALRAFPPGGSSVPWIGCSIDPTEQGMAAMQQFLRSIGSRVTPNDTQAIVEGLRTSLGYHIVSINGVPPKTHFAQVLVEADYRMKLIGIGLERPPVKLVSYIDRAKPSSAGHSSLQRWFFTPDYQCIRVTDDRLAMELVGDGVKLVGEDELVTAGGQRHSSGRVDQASQAFVTSFTKQYPALAERSPVYAELRNLIDLVVAAAYIRDQDYYTKVGWKMEFFGDEAAFPVETYTVPKMVDSAVNAVWKGRNLLPPIGGGVNIQPAQALDSENLLTDEKGEVANLHEAVVPNLAQGQWWWD